MKASIKKRTAMLATIAILLFSIGSLSAFAAYENIWVPEGATRFSAMSKASAGAVTGFSVNMQATGSTTIAAYNSGWDIWVPRGEYRNGGHIYQYVATTARAGTWRVAFSNYPVTNGTQVYGSIT